LRCTMVGVRTVLVFAVIAAACESAPPPKAAALPVAVASSPAPVREAPLVTADVKDAGAGEGSDGKDGRSLLDAWNDAHRRHDTQALAALYGAKVAFYGSTLSGAECVSRKASAFASAPDYSQSLTDVRLVPDGNGGTYVGFTKTWTSKGKSAKGEGFVYFDDGHIVAEGDGGFTPTVRWDWCVWMTPLQTTPDILGLPGDQALGDYKVSPLEAVESAARSQHVHDVGARAHASRVRVVVKECPYMCAGRPDAPCGKPCDPKVARCDPYKLGIQSVDTGSMLEEVEVDAMSKVLYWHELGKLASEPPR